LPFSLGFDLKINDTPYLGLGSILAFNYSLTKNIYLGINAEINYYINNPYEEITGHKDAAIGIDENGDKVYQIDGKGNPILTTPIIETKNHFGSYIHIKPTIAIGRQY
jgi:hypothetical protein